MKQTRFYAAANGLIEKAKVTIRRNQVENSIKKMELTAQENLLDVDEQINACVKEIAMGSSSQVGSNLTHLAELMQKKEEIVAQMEYAKKVSAFLDEQIEVEDTTTK